MLQNLILFSVTALIWGSTWLAIKFQLGNVMPLWSVVYRFTFAGLILIIYCLITRHHLRFNVRQHGWIALQAFFIYCTNYILFYAASHYFVSGIVSTLFASIIVWNIINGRIFLRNTIHMRVIIGSIIGIIGLICIMWGEVLRLEGQDYWSIIEGIALGIGGTLSASLGQITTVANVRRGLPLIQSNALGYVYGALFTMVIAVCLGQNPSFDASWSYMGSLIYLSLFGTVIAFMCYLTLIERMGADKGAYVFIFTPIIALILSSFFENLTWSGLTLFGISLAIMGNVLVMVKRLPSWKKVTSN